MTLSSDTRALLRTALLPLGMAAAGYLELLFASGWLGSGLWWLAAAELAGALSSALLIAALSIGAGWSAGLLVGAVRRSTATPRVRSSVALAVASVTGVVLSLYRLGATSWNWPLPWGELRQFRWPLELRAVHVLLVALPLVALLIVSVVLWRRWQEPTRVPPPRATCIALLAATGFVALEAAVVPESGGPDVLLVTVDTLRADRLGYAGATRPTSPHIDRLAASGVVFEEAVAPASWTLPSLASLLTARHPSEHGATGFGTPLPRRITSLAEVLKNAGYRTVAVTSHLLSSRRYGLAQGFDDFSDRHVLTNMDVSSRRLTDVAIERSRRRSGRPLFLWVHYFDPHSAYLDHPDQGFAFVGAYRDAYTESTLRHRELARGELDHVLDLYDEEIASTDAEIGRLLEAWRARASGRDDLVVLTSDHGELFGEKGLYGHGFVHQPVLRVPLIFAGSALPGPPRTVGSLVEVRALAPTLLRLLEIRSSPLPVLPGLLDGSERDRARPVLVEAFPMAGAERPRAAFFGRYKLVQDAASGAESLFDLEADPGEDSDLLLMPSDETQDIAQRLRAFLARSAGALPVRGSGGLTAAERDSLRSLGYLE